MTDGRKPGPKPREKMIHGYVYVLEHELGPMKIGVSKDVHARVSGVQVGSPFDIRVKNKQHCYKPYDVEEFLHNYFSVYRMSGEWFAIPPGIRDFDIPERINDSGTPSTIPCEKPPYDRLSQWQFVLDRLFTHYPVDKPAEIRALRADMEELGEDEDADEADEDDGGPPWCPRCGTSVESIGYVGSRFECPDCEVEWDANEVDRPSITGGR